MILVLVLRPHISIKLKKASAIHSTAGGRLIINAKKDSTASTNIFEKVFEYAYHIGKMRSPKWVKQNELISVPPTNVTRLRVSKANE